MKYTKNSHIIKSDLYLKAQNSGGRPEKLPIGDNILCGNILITGDAHTGKTSLALSIASLLRHKYPNALFVFVNDKKEYLPLFQKDTDILFSCHDASPYRHFRWNLSEECLQCSDPKKELVNCINLLFQPLPKNPDMDAVKEILFTAFSNEFSHLHPATVGVPANQDIIRGLQHRSFIEIYNMVFLSQNKKEFSDEFMRITDKTITMMNQFLSLFAEGSSGSGYDTVSSFLKQPGGALFLDNDGTKSSLMFILLLLSLILRKKQDTEKISEKKIYLIWDDPSLIDNVYFSDILSCISEQGSRTLLTCNMLNRKMEGFSNLIAFQSTDKKTLNFEQQYFGENKKFLFFKDILHIGSSMPTDKDFLIPATELTSLSIGSAYVKMEDSAPKKLYFTK